MSKNKQQKIGYFIKRLREERGMTQKDLAEALETSQSAVARMETGNQNFTTNQLSKISDVLGRKIISLDESIDFKIEGPNELSGSVETNTSKNGSLGLMCAALLNESQTVLHGIPQIEEVYRMIEILESLGVEVKWEGKKTIFIDPPQKFDFQNINREIAKEIRSSLMLIGALIHKTSEFRLPHSGGCKMGERTIAAHEHGLKKLGVDIEVTEEEYVIKSENLKPNDVVMYEASDTATENMLIAAALIPGTTKIEFAPPNYQVRDVCYFLEKCGVKIEGVGTTTLKVHGVNKINQKVEHHNSEDPIESMMFISAAATTNSELTIKRCPIDFLKLELLKLEKMGLEFDKSEPYKSENGRTDLVDLKIHPSELKALDDKIHALPYPGINADNLPFFVPIATQAEGETLIHDWMWENRAIYFTELNRLGADIKLADPHRVFVNGPTELKGNQVVCPPALRPAMIILISMLAAEGTSILRNVYSIKRGYEGIAKRLSGLGADIEVMQDI
ncbi:MAG: helix-turn-helix domain-containing protein [Candidatus Magasanikbacteria bacterium]